MPWAPLVGPERYDSEATRAVGYDFLDPTLLQSLKAGVGEELSDFSPTGAAVRTNELDDALGKPVPIGRGGLYPGPKRTPITEEQWKGSADFRPGLSYFDGMTAEAAKILAERADVRARRSDVLNRTEGFGTNSAVFAARFLSQLADPIGLAANFIPVVGEARYARMLAQLGRPGARAGAPAGLASTAPRRSPAPRRAPEPGRRWSGSGRRTGASPRTGHRFPSGPPPTPGRRATGSPWPGAR